MSQPETRRLFDYTSPPLVAPLLFAANFGVFLMMAALRASPLSPTIETLQNWGANYGPLTTAGEWWRLLTATFLHGGLQHLLINLWLLFFVGAVTERLFGHMAFLAIYLLSAFGGSLLSVYWHPALTSVGASGAICGLYGALLAFLLLARGAFPTKERSSLRNASFAFVATSLLLGLVVPQVDVAAHVGGLVVGVLVGLALAQPGVSYSDGTRARRGALAGCLGFAVLGLAAWSLPVQDDWRRDVQTMFGLEADAQSAIEEATVQVGARRMTAEAFGDYVRRQVLPPWRQHRERMAALRVSPRERAIVNKALAYMDRRATAWALADAPARGDDAARMDQSQRANAAASETGREFLQALIGRPR